MNQKSDGTLLFIKFSRVISYLVYAFTIVAVVSLSFGFFFLLFSANPNTPFVQFIYKVSYEFLQPFRGIFPAHSVGETGYFSAAALFAIIFYLLFAAAINALIGYINLKMYKHQKELQSISKNKQ
ncbi:MAG: hypothetical protein QG675_502 [Patescibacteria group bacterium]|jgi:uncharacterized protein YggT (Ycf19 family)|nr:hypothetical protein [Patescibacteria group bacterium]